MVIDTPPMNAQYQWRRADRRRPAMRRSRAQTLAVAPHIIVKRSNRFVTGRVVPPRPGAAIDFYASDGQGGDEEEWTAVGSATVGPSGTFRHRALRGGVEYIAILTGNDHFADGVSRRFR